MPKPWAAVASSPEYQALPPQQQEAARQQYFAEVVAPQIGDPAQVQQAKSQFDAQTVSKASKPDFSGVTGGVRQYPAKQQQARSQFMDMGDALQHNLINAPIGIAQLASHGVNSAIQAVAGGSDYANGVQQRMQASDAQIAQREEDYQARTPDNAGSFTGAVVGEVLPWIIGMGEARALGLLPKITATGAKGVAQKGGLLAAEGGVMGASQPVVGGGSYGRQKALQVGVGAAAAPALAGGTALLGKGASATRYLTGAGRDAIANERLAKLYGTNPAALSQLRSGVGIPGFNLTPAQALATPEAVQAERMMRNGPQTGLAFAEREALNNLALRQQAARLAGTDAEMEAARTARSEGPGAFWKNNLARGAEDGRYGRAQKHLAEVLAKGGRMSAAERDLLDQARKITGAIQRGTMDMAEGDAALRNLQPGTRIGQKAIAQALGVIDGGMVNPSRIMKELQILAKDTNPTISGAAEKALAILTKNQDNMGWVHGRVLDGLRQNFGKLLADSAPITGAGSAEGAAYGPVKAKIVNTLDRAVPGYRANLASYASASQPINDMEAGRTLLAAIDSGGRDASGNQAVSLTQLKTMLARDSRAQYPMSAAARQKAEQMLEALQRRSVTNNTVAAAGPGTAADLIRGGGQSPVMQRGLAALLATGGMAAGGPWTALGTYLASEGAQAANNSVLRRMGSKAADANATADAIEAYRKLLLQKQSSPQSRLTNLMFPYQP